MMDELYPYLIMIGGSMLGAAAWLLYLYKAQMSRGRDLIHLNESVDYDLPNFLRRCWGCLKAGGFSGFTWKLDWFGTPLAGEHGVAGDEVMEKQFDIKEISLVIRLYFPQRGWENRYFSRALAENFFLLMRMDLWIKIGTVRGAFEQSAKIAVFFQHDMKNLLQLISLSADQLENPVPGQELKLLAGLQEAVPAIRDRARHMLGSLDREREEGRKSSQELSAVLRRTAGVYDLTVTIAGSATVNIQEDKLQSIIDNILGNYTRQSRADMRRIPDLQIEIESRDGLATVKIQDMNGAPCPWPERLFEPFWSEHGRGRGIGLYEARLKAFSAGGNLAVQASPDKPLRFILSLPAAA